MLPTNLILGITGGIAAYKTPALIRLLKKQGCTPRVVLSKGASAFVTPLTLQAISGHPVYTDLLDTDFEAAMGHIELAKWADAILIAPASANRIAALAHGLADDLLSTLCLASKATLYIAPSMNQQMWHHCATVANLALLQERGAIILGPDSGEQACGDSGLGRMLEPEVLVEYLREETASDKPLAGKHILITAGPTREPLDPVRYLSNRSSGKMGFALAKAANHYGAKVSLIAGPVSLPTPYGVHRSDVCTAQEMCDVVMDTIHQADIFIAAAAVADFQSQQPSVHKIKKQNKSHCTLKLVPTPDILARVTSLNNKPYCVGFAAETEDGRHHAQQKLKAKNCDLVAMNDVSKEDIGFEVEQNQLTVFSHNAIFEIPKSSKYQVALALMNIISEQIDAKSSSQIT